MTLPMARPNAITPLTIVYSSNGLGFPYTAAGPDAGCDEEEEEVGYAVVEGATAADEGGEEEVGRSEDCC
jgi:hypothetical protein